MEQRIKSRETQMAPVRRRWFGAESRKGVSGWTKAGLGLTALGLAGIGGLVAKEQWVKKASAARVDKERVEAERARVAERLVCPYNLAIIAWNEDLTRRLVRLGTLVSDEYGNEFLKTTATFQKIQTEFFIEFPLYKGLEMVAMLVDWEEERSVLISQAPRNGGFVEVRFVSLATIKRLEQASQTNKNIWMVRNITIP